MKYFEVDVLNLVLLQVIATCAAVPFFLPHRRIPNQVHLINRCNIMGSVPNSAVPPNSKYEYIHRTVRIFYKCWYSKTFFKTFRLNSAK